jgi:cytochrome c6
VLTLMDGRLEFATLLRVIAGAGCAWMLAAAPSLAAAPGSGEQAYLDNCAACHQSTGLGISGAFPALKGNKLLLGDPSLAAASLLYGRNAMPGFKDSLRDADLAKIATYARAAWGNKAAAIPPSVFATVRKAPPRPRP